MSMFKPGPELMQTIGTIGVILFFAIVHATSQLKIHRDNKRDFDFIDYLILLVIGCGSGALFGIGAMLVWEENFIVVILMSAVGAVSGMAGLNKFAGIMLDVFTNMIKK